MADSQYRRTSDNRYRYVALDKDGKTVRGTANAADPDALYDYLLSGGLYMQSATKIGGTKRKVKISAKQLSEFCLQLSQLLASGISLVRALTIVSEEEELKPDIRGVYESLLAELRKGTVLSVALDMQDAFPPLMIAMIRAGEETGSLDKVTARLSVHYEKEHQLNQQVKSAMTYPCVLGVLAVGVVIILMTFVLPQFGDLFDMMEELPAMTLFLMDFSDFLIHKWYVVLIVAVLIAVAIRILWSVPGIKLIIDRTVLEIPLIGPMNRVICTARFARTLSSLYSSGVPIVVALQTGRDTVGNSYIAAQFDRAITEIRSGVNLSVALEPIDGFHRKLTSTIRVGEETGQLDAMLNSVADAMEYDSQQASLRIMKILEPAMIVFMAGVVGFIMIAVMSPIMQSYGAIEGSANL